MFAAVRMVCVASAGITLSACASALVQGEGSPQLPARPLSSLVAYVAGPVSLVASFQADIAVEAAKRGIAADNALVLFPPTRAYAQTEISAGSYGAVHRRRADCQRWRCRRAAAVCRNDLSGTIRGIAACDSVGGSFREWLPSSNHLFRQVAGRRDGTQAMGWRWTDCVGRFLFFRKRYDRRGFSRSPL